MNHSSDPVDAENFSLKKLQHQTALPIDAYQDEILQKINRDRVTIIHGEPGTYDNSVSSTFHEKRYAFS